MRHVGSRAEVGVVEVLGVVAGQRSSGGDGCDVVERVERLVGVREERHLVLRRSDQQGDRRGHRRCVGVERVAGERGTVDDGSQRVWTGADRTAEHPDLRGHDLPGRDGRAVVRGFAATPSSSTSARVVAMAASGDIARSLGPLCTIARWNRPVAAGTASSVETLAPPPDSPKIVTFDRSPPKALRRSPAPSPTP